MGKDLAGHAPPSKEMIVATSTNRSQASPRAPMLAVLGMLALALGGGAALMFEVLGSSTRLSLPVAAGFVTAFAVGLAAWYLSRSVLVGALFAYLVGPYFGNRLTGSVALGDLTERSSGTVPLLMVGDAFLLIAISNAGIKRNKVLALTVFVGTLAAGSITHLFVDPDFLIGASAAQAITIFRAALFGMTLLRFPSCDLKLLVRSFSIAIGLLATAVIAVVTVPTLSRILELDGRAALPGWGNNQLAAALALSAIVLTGLPRRLRSQRHLTVVPLILLAVIATGGRSAIAIAVPTCAILFLTQRLERSSKMLAVTCISGLALVGVILAPSLVFGVLSKHSRFESTPVESYQELREVVADDGPARIRGELSEISLAMFWDSPAVGVGLGQWNRLKYSYDFNEHVLLDPHNGYLWLLAETGLAGVSATVIGALTLIRLARLLRADSACCASVALSALLLEFTNANLQKPLYSLVAATAIALALRSGDGYAPSRDRLADARGDNGLRTGGATTT